MRFMPKLVVALALFVLLAPAAPGATNYFDVIPGTTNLDGGFGNWGSSTNWKANSNDTSGGSWTSGNDAWFQMTSNLTNNLGGVTNTVGTLFHAGNTGMVVFTNGSLMLTGISSLSNTNLILNLTSVSIGSGGITNNNTGSKTISLGSNVNLTAEQTWTYASGGNLTIAGLVNLGGFTLAMVSPGNVNQTFSGNLTGGGNLMLVATNNIAGSFIITGTNTYTGFTLVLGTAAFGTASSVIQQFTGVISNQGVVKLSANAGTTNFIGSQIVGTGVVNQSYSSGSGNGIYFLTNANTYSGGTVVGSPGTLWASNASALGTGPVLVSNATAIINFAGFTHSLGNVYLTNGILTNGNISTPWFEANAGTVAVNVGGAATFNKVGAGTVTVLSTNNTYSGGTLVNQGILQFNNSNGMGGTARDVYVSNGAVAVMNFLGVQGALTNRVRADSAGVIALGAASANESLDFNAARLTNAWLGAGSTLVYGGAYTAFTNTLRFAAAGGNLILTNAFRGNTNILVSGPLGGSVILSNANNSQSGTITVINGGVLQAASDGVLGDPSNGVTLTNGTLVAGGSMTLGASRTITLAGSTGYLGGAASTAVFTLDQPGHLAGSAILMVSGGGTVAILTNQTSYAGSRIVIGPGTALRANEGAGLSNGVNLVFGGGVLESAGNATFSRTNSAAAGGYTGINGTSMGWSALNGTHTVNLGGDQRWTVWTTATGTNGLAIGGGSLLFGSSNANGMVDFVNNLDLQNASRTISVFDNTATNTDVARISGKIWGGGASAALTKSGPGTLWLTNANNLQGGVIILGNGVLRATEGVGLPSDTKLVMNGTGGIFESERTSSFLRSVGTNVVGGQLTWTNSSGFSAWGGKLTVNLGGTAPTLVWGTNSSGGAGTVGFLRSGDIMYFGSSNADSEVEFQNGLDLNGGPRTVQVNDNTLTNSDFATISGVIANGTLIKAGAGKLVLSGANTYAGGTTNSAGVLALGANNALGGGTLVMAGGTLGASGGSRSLTNAINVSVASGLDTSDGDLTLSGVLSNSLALGKVGSGTVTLLASNFYSGTLAINAGQVVLGGTWAAQNAVVSNMVAGGLAFSNANAFTVAGLSGTGGIGLTNLSDGSGVTLSVGASNSTYRGDLKGGSLVKVGAGTLTLGSGALVDASTPVTINAGVLALNGGTLIQNTLYATNISDGLSLQAGTITVSNGFLLLGASPNLGSVAGGSFTMNILGGTSNAVIGTPHFGNAANMVASFNFLGGTNYLGSSVTLGEGTGSTGLMVAAGAATRLVIGTTLSVGSGSSMGTLLVTNGAWVDQGGGGSGNNFSLMGIGSSVLVDDGTLVSTNNLVFVAGATNLQFVVTNGGYVAMRGIDISSAKGIGNRIVVASGSAMTNINGTSGNVSIGGAATNVGNQLLVLDGGRFGLPGTLSIGSSQYASNNSVVIAGANSILSAGGGLNLGLGGATATNNVLMVTNGGTLLLGAGGISVGAGLGQVIFDNGTLRAGVSSAFFISNSVPVFIGAGGLYLDDSGSNITIQAVLADSPNSPGGFLNKTDNGVVTLLTNSTYTGGTIISNGVLQVGTNNGVVGSILGSVENYGTLAFSRGDTFISSNVISGTGNLLKLGSGTMILVSNSTYTGATIISNGVLQIGVGGASGWFGGTVSNYSLLAISRSDTVTLSNSVYGGSGSLNVSNTGDGNLNLVGGFGFASVTNFGGTMTVVGGLVSSTNMLLTGSGANPAVLNITGGTNLVSGPLGIGVGGANVAAVNVFTGGTLLVTNNVLTALGVGGGPSGALNVLGGTVWTPVLSVSRGGAGGTGTVLLAGGSITISNTFEIGYAGAGFLLVSNGLLTTSPGMSLGATSAGPGYATFVGGTNTFLGGNPSIVLGVGGGSTGIMLVASTTQTPVIYATNSGSIVRVGGAGFGQLTISNGMVNLGQVQIGASGAGAYGVLSIAGGTNNISAALNVANLAGTTGVFAMSGGQLNLGGNMVTTGVGTVALMGGTLGAMTSWTATAGLLLTNQYTSPIGTVGTMTGPGIVTFAPTGAAQTITLAGAVSGNGTLVKDGAGALILSNNNTYTGGTIVSNGLLQVGMGSASGWVKGDITSYGTVAFSRSDSVTFSNQLLGTGGLLKLGAGTLVLVSNQSYSGGTVVSNGTLQVGAGGTSGWAPGDFVNVGTVTLARSDDVTFSNRILGLAGTINQNGPGALFFTGTASNSTLSVAGGTMVLGGGGSMFLTNAVDIFGGAGLTVLDGGLNVVGSSGNALRIGGASAGTLTMADPGALVMVTNGTVRIGQSATGSLVVSSGTLLAKSIELGGNVGGQGNLSLLGGTNIIAGGVIAGNAAFSMGNVLVAGNSTFLNVSNAGTLNIGNGTNSVGTLTVTGGTVLVAGALNAGGFAFSTGTVLLAEAAGDSVVVRTGGLSVGVGTNAFGSVVVSNVNFTSVGTVSIGSSYGTGALTLFGGSNTFTANFNLGSGSGTGTLVATDGAMVLSTNSTGNNLNIGNGSQGSGLVVVSNGSTFWASTITTLGAVSNSRGSLVFDNSTAWFTNSNVILAGASNSVAALDISGGTANLYGITLLSAAATNSTASARINGAAVNIGVGGIITNQRPGSTATLEISGSTIGALANWSATAPITLTNTSGSATTVFAPTNAAHTIRLLGAISGNGALVKDGAGVLVLSNANTYGGGTIISNGGVVAWYTNALGSGGITMTASGALGYGNTFDPNALLALLPGGTPGTFGLGANSSSNLSFAADAWSNLFFGAVGGTFTNGGVFTPNGTTYRLGGGGGTLVYTNAIYGGSNLVVGSGGTVALTASNAFTGGTLINAGGTLNVGNNGTSPVILSGQVTNMGTLVLQQNVTRASTMAISGTGSVWKTDANILQITNANSEFSGVFALGAGTLSLGDDNALGTGTFLITNGTVQAYAGSGARTITNAVQVGGPAFSFVATAGNGPVNLPIYFAGPVDLGGSMRTISVLNLSNTVFTGTISGAGGITFAGPRVLTLSGSNTYSGGTVVNGGILQILNPNSVPAGASVTVNFGGGVMGPTNNQSWLLSDIAATSTGALVLVANSSEDLDFASAGLQFLSLSSLGTNVYTGTLTPYGGVYRFGGGTNVAGTGTLILSNNLTGGNSVLIVGNGGTAGRVMLQGQNTYSGGTLISTGGYLQVVESIAASGPSAVGTAATIQIAPGGTFEYSGTVAATNARPIEFAAGPAGGYSINALNAAGPLTLTADFVGSATGTNAANIVFKSPAGGRLNVMGQIGDVGPSNVTSLVISRTASATGPVTYLGGTNNTFSGSVTILAGATNEVEFMANLGQASSLGTGVGGGATNFIIIGEAATTLSPVLSYVGAADSTSDRLIRLQGGGANVLAILNNSVSNANFSLTATGPIAVTNVAAPGSVITLNLGGSGRGTSTLAGNLSDPNPTNKLAVLVNGVGTWVLGGANTFSGGVALSNSPTLLLTSTNALGGTARVLVNFGTALGGLYANAQAFLLDRMDTLSMGAAAVTVSNLNEDFDFNAAGLTNAFLGAATDLLFGGTYTPYGGIYRLGGGNGALTFTNAISGASSLVIGGGPNSSVILNNANSFTGGTMATGGVLRVGNNDALGVGTITMAGGMLQAVDASAQVFTNNLVFTSNAVFGAAGTGDLTFNNANFGGSTRVLTVSNAVTTFSGITTNVGLTKAGPGTLVLARAFLTNLAFSGKSGAVLVNGGLLTTTNLTIGNAATDSGILALAGGVTVTNMGLLTVGNSGTGNGLALSNGVVAFSSTLSLGAVAGARSNSLVVADSSLGVVGTVSIGAQGSYNSMSLLGTSVVVSGTVNLGNGTAGTNNSVTMSGGSKWFVAGNMAFGSSASEGTALQLSGAGTALRLTNGTFRLAGNNGSLFVSDGASLYATGTDMSIGHSGLTNNIVVVTGPGSSLTTLGNAFYLGYGSAGSQLVISNSGVASIGPTVSMGANSLGTYGSRLLVADEGILTVGGLTVGLIASDAGVAVIGSGSVLTNLGTTFFSTSRNSIVVTNGASAYFGGQVSLGNGLASTSNQLLISDNAQATFGGAVVLGASSGVANTLAVSNGASVSFGGAVTVGSGGSSNRLVLDGVGAPVMGSVTVGGGANGNFGNELVLDHGASLDAGSTFYVAAAVSTNNAVTVKGGSRLAATGVMSIGQISNSVGNRMVVQGGSLLNARSNLYVGQANGTVSNLLLVEEGSLVLVSNNVNIGNAGVGASLASNAMLVVRNAAISNFLGDAVIGNIAYGSSLVMSNQATFYDAGSFYVSKGNYTGSGGAGAASGNSALLTDGGTVLTTLGVLVVGGGTLSHNNSMLVSNGATVIADVGQVGAGTGGTNNSLVLTGSRTVARFARGIQVGTTGNISPYSSPTGTGYVVVADGATLETVRMDAGSSGSGTISNFGGVYQFTTNAPTINPGSAAGSITLSAGTLSFRGASNVNIKGNWGVGSTGRGLTNITFVGDNVFRLNNAGTANAGQDYVFDTGLGASNYVALEMVNGSTLWQGGVLGIGSGGSLLISNTVATINSAVTNLGSLLATAASATYSGGVFVGSGASYTSLSATNAFGGGLTLASGARYSVDAASLVTGVISNQGSINVDNGSVFRPTSGYTSSDGSSLSIGSGGTMVLTGGTFRLGGMTNLGNVNVQNGQAAYGGAVVLGGLYSSDPSTNTFLTNVTVTASGAFSGGVGDQFVFGADLLMQSTNRAQFNLALSSVLFTNAAGASNHILDLTGSGALDKGSNWLSITDLGTNFAIGKLSIAAGNKLTLLGDRGTNALYVGILELVGVNTSDPNAVTNALKTMLELPTVNLYYDATIADNAWLDDQIYDFADWGVDHALLIPIPEPSPLLAIGAGLAFLLVLHRRKAS